MLNCGLIFLIALLVVTSCLSTTKEKCQIIDTSEIYLLDSIGSGLAKDDGIYAVHIHLQGKTEGEIEFNGMRFQPGPIDSLISNRDQYGTFYIYELINNSGENVDLDVCVKFLH